MKKEIITMLGILMIASVIAMYSGESITITLPEQYDYYTIVGNSTPVILDIEQDDLVLTITVNKYQQEDEFELVFFNKEKETITNTVYRGGGGGSSSRIKYIDRNITMIKPEYRDKEIIKEIPIDNIIKEYVETGYEFWHIALAIVGSLVFAYILLWFFRSKKAEVDEDDN